MSTNIVRALVASFDSCDVWEHVDGVFVWHETHRTLSLYVALQGQAFMLAVKIWPRPDHDSNLIVDSVAAIVGSHIGRASHVQTWAGARAIRKH